MRVHVPPSALTVHVYGKRMSKLGSMPRRDSCVNAGPHCVPWWRSAGPPASDLYDIAISPHHCNPFGESGLPVTALCPTTTATPPLLLLVSRHFTQSSGSTYQCSHPVHI